MFCCVLKDCFYIGFKDICELPYKLSEFLQLSTEPSPVPSSVSISPLPQLSDSPGYIMVYKYQSYRADSCNGAVSITSQLIGVCIIGLCNSGTNGCVASVTYVVTENATTSSFSTANVEFSSSNCNLSTAIASSIKTQVYSKTCVDGMQTFYYAGSSLSNKLFPSIFGGFVRRSDKIYFDSSRCFASLTTLFIQSLL